MPPTPKAPSVEYRHNVARGRHEIGVKLEGAFVPFATMDDDRAGQLIENARTRDEVAADATEEEEA